MGNNGNDERRNSTKAGRKKHDSPRVKGGVMSIIAGENGSEQLPPSLPADRR
jgi:hypothetical protein